MFICHILIIALAVGISPTLSLRSFVRSFVCPVFVASGPMFPYSSVCPRLFVRPVFVASGSMFPWLSPRKQLQQWFHFQWPQCVASQESPHPCSCILIILAEKWHQLRQWFQFQCPHHVASQESRYTCICIILRHQFQQWCPQCLVSQESIYTFLNRLSTQFRYL